MSAFCSPLLNLATGTQPKFHYRCQNASSGTSFKFACACYKFAYLQNGALMLVPFTVVLHVVILAVFQQKFNIFVAFVSQNPALKGMLFNHGFLSMRSNKNQLALCSEPEL